MTYIGQCQIFAIFNLLSKNASLSLKALFVQQAVCLEVLYNCEGIVDLKTRISSEITRFERAGLLVDDRTADCFGRNI